MPLAINRLDGHALITQHTVNSWQKDKVDTVLAIDGSVLTTLQ